MKLALGRIVSIFMVAGGWLVVGIRIVLDLIGYSTAPEDIEIAQTRLDQLLGGILSLPWWVPWGFALISTVLLIWASWPRQVTAAPKADTETDGLKHVDDLDVVANKNFESMSLRIDGRRFINCTFKDTLIQWEGEEFRLEGCDLSQKNHFVTHNRQNQVMLELAKQIGLIPLEKHKRLRGDIAEAIMRAKEPNVKL